MERVALAGLAVVVVIAWFLWDFQTALAVAFVAALPIALTSTIIRIREQRRK
jgi:hypothetical protein